ncbi:MAG: protein kinase domain-containing protein [Capsulimonadaceae bacterium]
MSASPTAAAQTIPHNTMSLGQIGKYERLDVLGHGASGIVYLARDTLLGKQVALKEISAQGEERDHLLAEARVLDRLRHRNIVHVNSVDQVGHKLLIDMEFVHGRNLQDLLREEERLSTPVAVAIGLQICEGLAYAHSKRTVHRDVKPANIIISDDGVVKLVDFGLAEVLGTNSFAGGAGTYAYMAPEDFGASDESDRQSDVWAAGVILYEMIAGTRPFRVNKVKDPFAWKLAIENDPITPISTIQPAVPQEIDSIIARALARDKRERYQDAGEMAADLRVLAGPIPECELQVAALIESHWNNTPAPTIPAPTIPPAANRVDQAPVKRVDAAEDRTVAATPRGSDGPPGHVAGFPGLKDVDDFILRAPDHWEEACAALDGGSLSKWLRTVGEGPLADVADELVREETPSSDRLRDFLYRAGIETAEDARVRYEAGVRQFDAGRFDDAVVQMRGAVHLDPTQPHHYQYLARALRAKGDHSGAIAAFEEALEHHPNDRALRREYADLARSAVALSTDNLDFGVLRTGQEKTIRIVLRNMGGGMLKGRVLSTPEWLRVVPENFTTRQRQPLTLTADSTRVWKTPSSCHEAVVLETTGGRRQIQVRLSVLPSHIELQHAWYWYIPLLLACIAPIIGVFPAPTILMAPGLIVTGLLAISAGLTVVTADGAVYLRWPFMVLAPMCLAGACAILSQPTAPHHEVWRLALLLTGPPAMILLVLQAIALAVSPKGWGRWQV